MNKKSKPLIVSLALILIIILVSILVFLQKVKEIISISNEINDQKSDLESKYQNKQNFKSAYENLNLIKTGQQKIFGATIKKGQELEFITTIEKIFTGKNLNENISLSPPDKNKNDLQKLGLTIFLEGSFIDVMNAINGLEKSPYYIILENLDFSTTTVFAPAVPPVTGAKKENTPPPAPVTKVKATLSGYTLWQP